MSGFTMWQNGMEEAPVASLAPHGGGYSDYAALIDPTPLRSLACHIVDPHRDPKGWNLIQAAAIFDFV
ncbi:MAG: hypothetical protein ABIT01_02075 [Thermoanaerobaculia bacterium]